MVFFPHTSHLEHFYLLLKSKPKDYTLLIQLARQETIKLEPGSFQMGELFLMKFYTNSL